ncbi:MAG: VIT1/CCC1 transporter family protein [Gammaproteobacteria bacterium]|jgi:VIT1/CCC1 family predicted Fe2+/Mn2+ transporter
MSKPPIRRFLANCRAENDSAFLYRTLAELSDNEQLAAIYHKLADAEYRHADFWGKKLRAAGHEPPAAEPGRRARLLAWLARRFGPGLVLPVIAGAEAADTHGYHDQPEARHTSLPAEEAAHNRLVHAIIADSSGGLAGASVARLEGRHRGVGGNALRAAVLGANDGLVSNLSLVMGMAGAVKDNSVVLITGMAGLLAGAISMALGEWLSVQSARELHRLQLAIEALELEENPEEEKAELALIYQAKGLAREDAEALAARLIDNPETALDTLAREELGLDPSELGGSAWTAAGVSFLLFALGAIIPVIPFAIASHHAVSASLAVSGLGLFGIGAAITLMTGRGVWFSGLRQLAFGLVAAAVTYGLGHLVGIGLAG